MERLKHMKETLVGCVQSQLSDIHNVDTHELGEAIDMIKDLEQAMYYCSIVKAMEEKDEEHRKYYIPITPPYYLPDRDMDRNEWGRMYYPRSRDSQGRYTESDRGDMQDSRRNYGDRPIYYNEKEFPMDLRDSREGRSPMMRRMYMESKELHKDKEIKMKELDKYMKELSEDLVEMIDDASPEERQLLEKKISALATKISSLNHA